MSRVKTLFQKERNKRYYLHQKVRSEGYKVNAHKRTVYILSEDTITQDIKKLMDKYGYNVQTILVNVN